MNKHPLVMETAPSAVRQDEPTVWRWFGFIGWCAVLVGTIIALVNIFKGDRLATEWMGWLLVALGLVGAIAHAAVESDQLLRRVIGGVGALGLLVGVVIGIVLPLESVHLAKTWAVGLLPFLPGLIFIALFARQETEPFFKNLGMYGLGGIGFLLTLVGFIGAIIKPGWIAGPGGVVLVAAYFALLLYLSLVGSTSTIGYWSAVCIGILGAAIIAWALIRSIFPELLHEWRSPAKGYAWPAALLGAGFLAVGLLAYFFKPKLGSQASPAANEQSMKSLGRTAILIGIIVGLVGLGRLIAPGILRSTGWFASNPTPYLGGGGILLMVAGIIYLLTGITFASENRFIVMARREMTAFFVSPIAYIVIIGFAVIGGVNYWNFLSDLAERAELNQPLDEPIVRDYIASFFPVIAVMVAVPLLTMRLLSEEKRTGTYEVLVTAPVSEYLVVLSKFFAALLFFMLLFVSWMIYLVAMRLESGQAFDYRPLLSFLLALLTSGAGFIAMGLFFSCITRNQIIAAVLTFMGMIILVGLFFLNRQLRAGEGFGGSIKPAIRTMSFVNMWIEALSGKLWLRDVVYHLSSAVFWLFLSVKVLEARKWT
jgi:hypothetical protein